MLWMPEFKWRLNQNSSIWRFVRLIRQYWPWISQGLVLLVIGWFLLASWINLNQNLSQRNFGLGFDFLWNQAGFAIGESPVPFSPQDFYITALWIGLLNTLKVVGVGLVIATILGVTVGLARLSENWLVNRLALVYVQILRNTPLLLQLLFWYAAFFLSLPSPREPLTVLNSMFLSKQGMTLPWLQPTDSFALGVSLIGVGGLGAIALFLWLRRRRLRFGAQPRWLSFLPGGFWLLFIAIALWVSGGQLPVALNIPTFENETVKGGLNLSAEYSTLVIGLSLYTASFIAEIVRAGITAVPRGQWEASKSLGLSAFQLMGYVIFPQALRVIIPPLTSQYLNLAKNSSLAIAIGYPDLYAIASPTLNQTGRPIEVILILMAVYLTISLSLSFGMSLYNRSTQWGQAR